MTQNDEAIWDEIYNNLDDIVNGTVMIPSNSKTSPCNKNIKCFYCNKLFEKQRGLRQHCMQFHYKAFGYGHKCDQCTHKYKTKQALHYHISNNH